VDYHDPVLLIRGDIRFLAWAPVDQVVDPAPPAVGPTRVATSCTPPFAARFLRNMPPAPISAGVIAGDRGLHAGDPDAILKSGQAAPPLTRTTAPALPGTVDIHAHTNFELRSRRFLSRSWGN
jgi:hypothetical protein